MRFPALLTAALLSFGLAIADAEAAKRFGGGGNIGKQRATPTKTDAAPASTPATPTAPAGSPTAAPAGAAGAAGAAAAAKPSFMSRWGGLLAGLGIGALLASLFGAQMGPIIGMILAAMLAFGLIFLLYRLFASRGAPATAPATAAATADAGARPGFSGIGSRLSGGSADGTVPAAAVPTAASVQPDFDVPNFLRGAKASFIRLQAANDAKDLDDIRDFTTPQLYSEIAMLIGERGGEAQRTEVVSVDARLVEVAAEDGYDIASVRFTGLIRENDASNPEPFDEIWHVRKKIGDRNPAWLIGGIQQVAE